MPSDALSRTMTVQVEPLSGIDRVWAGNLISAYFLSPLIVSRGVLHDVSEMPTLVAVDDGLPCGLAVYNPSDDGASWEVLVLIADPPRRGTGRTLMQAVVDRARAAGCRRVWLTTTNDNAAAIAFYQAIGLQLVAVHEGAMAEARRLKPEIPETTADGTPVDDEIEFELVL